MGDEMQVIFRHFFLVLDRACPLAVVFFLCLWSAQLQAGEFNKTKCWFAIPLDRAMTCGTLNVPENRKIDTGTELTLSVAVFEPDRERHEPIVFLTGGPGQPADIGNDDDIKEWWQFISAQTWMIGRRVVVADQRGVGKSNPTLDCSQYFKADHWNAISLGLDAEINFDDLKKQEVLACKKALIAKGIDFSAYNTAENAADINDLRQALGIEKWVLYGVSYGTRLALEVMNQHPEGISASILDSVLPLDINYLNEDGPNLDRSLRLLERDCQRSQDCMRGLRDAVRVIARQLDKQPVLLRSEDRKARYRYVSGVDFLDLLFDALYDWETISTLPELIERTYRHDFRPLADMVFDEGDLEIAEGMDFSVTCSDNGWIKASRNRGKYWAKWAEADDYAWVCPLWFPESRFIPKNRLRRSNIPTLLLSGEFDPATPSIWAYRVAERLSLGQVIVFRGIGHDVIDSDFCGSEVVADFLANPRRRLKTSCISQMEGSQFTVVAEDFWPGATTQHTTGSRRTPKHTKFMRRFGRHFPHLQNLR